MQTTRQGFLTVAAIGSLPHAPSLRAHASPRTEGALFANWGQMLLWPGARA
jgi:hypothetical protein